MLKAVVGTENNANENQIKNLGKCIFISVKWKLPSLVRQDQFQNKLMSNPECDVNKWLGDSYFNIQT